MTKKKKIKVAFPHMGTISIAWAAGLRKVGVEPFIPPYTSKKTLSFGTKNSPEAICLPYKLILGNFIEAIEGGANGYYSPVSQQIVVKNDLPELQTIKTMIHEIAHASLGHGSKEDKWDREAKEVQAESVAYWVSQMLGLDTSEYSFGYISGWSKDKEVSELKDNLEIIKQTADKIFLAIEEKIQKLQEEKVEAEELPQTRKKCR